MLELPNFVEYNLSHVRRFVGDVMDRKINSSISIRSRVAICADIIKIITMFIKKIFKDSKRVKRIRNYVSKCNLCLYFLIWENLLYSGEKMLMSAELKRCVR